MSLPGAHARDACPPRDFTSDFATPCRYKEIVPTALTPAATINGELVWESMDILNRLEREFTERPLLPAEPELRSEAEEAMAEAEALGGAGFKCGAACVAEGLRLRWKHSAGLLNLMQRVACCLCSRQQAPPGTFS